MLFGCDFVFEAEVEVETKEVRECLVSHGDHTEGRIIRGRGL